MSEMYAYCGLNCATCQAYIATQANDREAQEKLLAQWRVEYQSPEMDLQAVTCDGCTTTLRLGGYCSQCAVRACGVAHGVVNCAHCAEFEGCEKLEQFYQVAPQVRTTLTNLSAALE